jgi:hypothetical protein
MAGELRAKLVAENRKAFGPKSTEPSEVGSHAVTGHAAGAGGHGPVHEALAKENAAGKAIDKTLEPHAHKLVKTGRYLTRTGTSTMTKSLMADETGKALGKALTKSGAQKVAGKVLVKMGGKLLPVIGQYDTAATAINMGLDTEARHRPVWEAAMNSDWDNDKKEMLATLGPNKPRIVPSGRLPTFGGKLIEAVEAPLRRKEAVDLAKKYPQYASRPSSSGPSGYGRLNQQ